jgi:hypothetical protein
MVKVHYSEGAAIHTDPESCAGHCREAVREALTGERIGQPLSRGAPGRSAGDRW